MNVRIFFRLLAFIGSVLLLVFVPWDIVKPDWLTRVLYYSVEFVIFITATELAKHIFQHYYRRRKSLKINMNDNFTEAINNLHYILIFFAVIITILSFVNLNFVDVITSLSIVAAAIAIISKDYLSNIISGMITVFTKEVEIEDNIQIQHHKGKVKSLTLSKMVLLNDDDDVVFIPNNVVFSTDFINYSKRTVRKTSIDFEINMERVKSGEVIEAFLRKGIESYQEYIDQPTIYLRIEEIAKDHISFKFQYTLITPDRELEREIRRKVKRDILKFITK
jgi:small-conductance mechanosensitive channel